MLNIVQNYWLLFVLGTFITALIVWGMAWFHKKKYTLHFWLTVLVGISTLAALLMEVRPRETGELFSGVNGWLLGGTARLDTSLYLYYVLIAVAALVFYLLPKKGQVPWLVLVSLFVFATWDLYFVLVLLGLTALFYGMGIVIDRQEDRKKKTTLVRVGVFAGVIALAFFKYNAQLFAQTGMVWALAAPVGISYYTFQGISYLKDLQAMKLSAERNPFRFLLYTAFFPKLSAGPIERAKDFLIQFEDKIRFEYETFLAGLFRMMWGMFKKVMLVNRLVVVTELVYADPRQFNGLQLLIGLLLSAFYIYFDFSSYMDLAIGAANVFGIRLSENFQQPYFATSIIDFWRRWHITFSSWLRDYLFIPLNFQSRRVRKPWMQPINVMLTFLVSGIWHGTTLNFILWGGYHGALQVFELRREARRKRLGKQPLPPTGWRTRVKVIGTFLLVSAGWVLFFSNSMGQLWTIVRQLFNTSQSFVGFGLDEPDTLVALVMVIFLLGMDGLERTHTITQRFMAKPGLMRVLLSLLILITMTIWGYYGQEVTVEPFYMQF